MKKLKKSKKSILEFILFVFMIYLFIVLGTKDYGHDVPDNIRFATEYQNVSKNNVFVYKTDKEILDVLENQTGIIFLGFPSNRWSSYYAKYLNDIALEENIEEIHYYDFLKDRRMNTKTYQKIVEKVKSYLYSSDTLEFDLNAPTIIVVKEGMILYFDNEMHNLIGEIKAEDYFTDYRENVIKTNLREAIRKLKGEEKNE